MDHFPTNWGRPVSFLQTFHIDILKLPSAMTHTTRMGLILSHNAHRTIPRMLFQLEYNVHSEYACAMGDLAH